MFCLLFVLRKLASASPRCAGVGRGRGSVQLQLDTGKKHSELGWGEGWLREGLGSAQVLTPLAGLLLCLPPTLQSCRGASPQAERTDKPEGAGPGLVGIRARGFLRQLVPLSPSHCRSAPAQLQKQHPIPQALLLQPRVEPPCAEEGVGMGPASPKQTSGAGVLLGGWRVPSCSLGKPGSQVCGVGAQRGLGD